MDLKWPESERTTKLGKKIPLEERIVEAGNVDPRT